MDHTIEHLLLLLLSLFLLGVFGGNCHWGWKNGLRWLEGGGGAKGGGMQGADRTL